jgi:ATP-binding cassette subfamily C protein LapB
MLNLRSASLILETHDKPLQALHVICQQLSLPKPKILKHPDRVHLPLICYTDELGWGLVIDRNPQNFWVVSTAQGQHNLGLEKLSANTALLRIAEPIQLGFGLSFLGAQAPDHSFSALVRQGLKQHRMALMEACLASGFIGVLSLATSLFSMQVYDRVIPTRSEYTLIILSSGVALVILFEMLCALGWALFS